MTGGHAHRVIRAREGSLVERLLCGPVLARTDDLNRVMASRWTWGQDERGGYRLRPLGVLHTLFGLTLDVTKPKEKI